MSICIYLFIFIIYLNIILHYISLLENDFRYNIVIFYIGIIGVIVIIGTWPLYYIFNVIKIKMILHFILLL